MEKFPEKSEMVLQQSAWRNSAPSLGSSPNLQAPSDYDEINFQGSQASELPYTVHSFEKLYGSRVQNSSFEPRDQKLRRRAASVPCRKHGDARPNPLPHPFGAPEKKITLFALRLALLEKTASGLGSLAFIWATVVLLGGIADNLREIDFWFMTIILLTEGTRIFSRSQELEWQHETLMTSIRKDHNYNYNKARSFRFLKNENSTAVFMKTVLTPFISICGQAVIGRSKDSVDVRRGLFGNRSSRKLQKRTWSSSNVPFLPYKGWLFVSQKVSRLLYCLQLLSASTCVVLSLHRLINGNFSISHYKSRENLRPILSIFYGLSLAEALVFLGERIYWQWQISVRKLLMEVNKECGLEDMSGLQTIRSFFYDTYSECVNGSIFDGLKMDLVSFANDLLQSSGGHGQLSGARLLSAFLRNDRFSEDTLRKIGSTQEVVERLLEMLNWKNTYEEDIRREAAEIICELVRKNRNCVRVAGRPGSLESIASLLSVHGTQLAHNGADLTDEVDKRGPALTHNYNCFNLLGLRILKNLAKDEDICAKIGTTRGLLPKIIGFTAVTNDPLPTNSCAASDPQIKAVKRSLQLLKLLSSCSGTRGNYLRREISGVVFAISNLRDILELAHHAMLQTLTVDILRNLAIDDDSRERIGGIGGVLRILFSLFLLSEGDGNRIKYQQLIVSHCGEALAILAFHNTNNCQRMIHIHVDSNNVITSLIAALNDPARKLHAAIILRNIWAYSASHHFHAPLQQVTSAASQILKVVMGEEQGKVEEAFVGLAAQIVKLMDRTEMDSVLNEAGISKRQLMKQMVNILEKHPFPSDKIPRIRRFSLQLVICLMQKEKENEETYNNFGLEEAIDGVMNSTNEVENFCTISGSMGLNRHYVTIQSLLQRVMDGFDRSTH